MTDESFETTSPFIERLRATREALRQCADSARMLELDAALFRPLVGQAFEATSLETRDSSPLVLERVSERPLPRDVAGRQPFSLLLTGPVDRILPQGTYGVSHPVLGAFEFFIVPLGPGADRRMTYQVVFG